MDNNNELNLARMINLIQNYTDYNRSTVLNRDDTASILAFHEHLDHLDEHGEPETQDITIEPAETKEEKPIILVITDPSAFNITVDKQD